MKTAFRKSFVQDLKKVKNQNLLKRVRHAIEQVEAATSLSEIANLKKLAGSDSCYRIRLGDYRLGIYLADDVIEFVRCLHRRDLYRFFP